MSLLERKILSMEIFHGMLRPAARMRGESRGILSVFEVTCKRKRPALVELAYAVLLIQWQMLGSFGSNVPRLPTALFICMGEKATQTPSSGEYVPS